MAKYFSFYPSYFVSGTDGKYSVYYDEINVNNYAKYAHTNFLLNNFVLGTPGEMPYNILNVEVPDSASSVIIVIDSKAKVFPLLSTPPTVGTLFLTFDTL